MNNWDFIVCGYSAGKKYHAFNDRLKKGLDVLNIEYDLEKYNKSNIGEFREIQLMKPLFVLEKLHKHKKPVMYVDIDMIFLSKPEIPKIHFDVGVVLRLNENGKFCPGALRCWNFLTLWNWTHNSYRLLHEWKDLCNPDTGKWIRRKNRRDHVRLNKSQKTINYKEIVLNKFISNDIIGYTNRGNQRSFIAKPDIPIRNERRNLLEKEKKIYGKVWSKNRNIQRPQV